MKAELLHTIGVYSNPRRWKARTNLFKEWVEQTLDVGVTLHVVEHALGERAYELDADDPKLKHVRLTQLRGNQDHELWIKEGLAKAGFNRAPEDAKYFCWQDTDVRHVRSDWAVETLHMLQHHRVGQTWSHAMDLGPDGECITNEWGQDVDRSFCWAWLEGDIDMPLDGYGMPISETSRALLKNTSKKKDWRQHYGYSWAIRRDTYSGIGGLLDWLVTGSADYHMAMGFSGKLEHLTVKELQVRELASKPGLSSGYVRRLREFAARCELHVKQDIGCVKGTLLHGWHGPKKNRQYITRKDIILESQFDPDLDIAYDMHGIPHLVRDNRILRDGLRRYNTQRNEDSIDT